MNTKYNRLVEELHRDISSYLDMGISKLPAERTIASDHNVSRQTVRQALLVLEQENLIRRIQGSGAHLTGIRPSSDNNTVALILCSDSEYIYPRLISDIRSNLAVLGYSLQIHVTDGLPSIERTVLNGLNLEKIRCIIAAPAFSGMPSPNIDLWEKFAGILPVIFLGRTYSSFKGITTVAFDNINGAAAATYHLISLSHTRIGGIFRSDDATGIDRYLGYNKAMNEADLGVKEENICWFNTNDLNNLQKKQDTRFLSDYIKGKLASCTAILCHNDEIAYWLIKELSHAGINVPQDLSVVGFDNSYLSDLSKTRITTATSDCAALADAACEAAVSRMCGRESGDTVIPVKIISKTSSLRIG